MMFLVALSFCFRIIQTGLYLIPPYTRIETENPYKNETLSICNAESC